MRQINPFFLIGTLGMLLTSMLHILLAVILSEEGVNSSFSILYPVFLGFLIVGTGVMIKKKKSLNG
jgi:hypothetical protein